MKHSHPHKPFKILVLSAKGWGTGSALRAFNVAEALKKRGHSVCFPRPLPTWPLWLDMALSTLYYLPAALFRKYDAVWCVKPYPTLVPACLIQKLLGVKVVFDVDDLDWAYSSGAFRPLHRLLQTPWPKLFGGHATYHNQALLGPLVEDFKLENKNCTRVAQAVDPSLFHPGRKGDVLPDAAKRLWGREARPKLVVTAHLNVACDLSPVLAAFSLILKKKTQARLLVAGGGPDQGRFEGEARSLGLGDAVAFTGPLTPRQVASCLRAADAALVYYSDAPANRHRASLKLREALACAVRVAATRVGEASAFAPYVQLSAPAPPAFAEAVLRAVQGPAKKRWKPETWEASAKSLEEALL